MMGSVFSGPKWISSQSQAWNSKERVQGFKKSNATEDKKLKVIFCFIVNTRLKVLPFLSLSLVSSTSTLSK